MPLPRCFMDFTVDDEPLGRVVFEVFSDVVPKTASNFLALCSGTHLSPSTRLPLTYLRSPVHRIIPGFMLQGGDVVRGNGTGGESIYGGAFADERLDGPGSAVDREGLLVMANRGRDTNKSQWFVTLGAAEHLNGKHVVFGRVVAGLEHIHTMGRLPTDEKDRPLQPVLVAHCGELELRRPAPAPKRGRTPSPSPSPSSASPSPSPSPSRRSRSPPPRRRYATESASPSDRDSASASEPEDAHARRKREKKARRAAREDRRAERRARKGRPHRDGAGAGAAGREETEAELDARLEREEKARLALAAEERRAQKEEEARRAREAGGVVYKGRGAMRYRDPETGLGGSGLSSHGGGRDREGRMRSSRNHEFDRRGPGGREGRDGREREPRPMPFGRRTENAAERGAGGNGRIQYGADGRWARGVGVGAAPGFERQRQTLDEELDRWGPKGQRRRAEGEGAGAGKGEREGEGKEEDMDAWGKEERKSVWIKGRAGQGDGALEGKELEKDKDEEGERRREGSEGSGASDMVLDLDD